MQRDMTEMCPAFNQIVITGNMGDPVNAVTLGVICSVSAAMVEDLIGGKNFFGLRLGRRQTKETERNGDQGGRAAAIEMKYA